MNNSVFFLDEMNFTIVPIFPMCRILDFHNYIDFGTSTPLRIYFKIKKTEDLALTLFLDERVRRVKRALKSLHHSYTGQDMETTTTIITNLQTNMKETRTQVFLKERYFVSDILNFIFDIERVL